MGRGWDRMSPRRGIKGSRRGLWAPQILNIFVKKPKNIVRATHEIPIDFFPIAPFFSRDATEIPCRTLQSV
eukprot:494734-Amorphochlora_amoeboformis.AAC.4